MGSTSNKTEEKRERESVKKPRPYGEYCVHCAMPILPYFEDKKVRGRLQKNYS